MLYSLSASSLESYQTCPKMFKFKYIDNVVGLPSDALLLGQMVHLALKNYHQLQDAYTEVKRQLYLLKLENAQGKFDEIKSLVECYRKNPIKDQTVEYEKRFKIPLLNSSQIILDTPISGIIDRMTIDGIIEYKTSSEDYDQKKVDESLQGTIYAYAFYHLKKKFGKITFCVLNKKTKSIQKINTTRKYGHFDELFNTAKKTYDDIVAGNYDPKPGLHCRWCNYRNICESANK